MKPNQRIATLSSSRYVCLKCRRAYKKSVWYTRSPHHISPRMAAYIAQAEAEGHRGTAREWRRNAELKAFATEFSCPVCRTLLLDVGPHFKAPRQSNIKAWQRVQRFLMEKRHPQLATMNTDEILKQRNQGLTPEELLKPRHKDVVRMQDTEVVYKIEIEPDWKQFCIGDQAAST